MIYHYAIYTHTLRVLKMLKPLIKNLKNRKKSNIGKNKPARIRAQ